MSSATIRLSFRPSGTSPRTMRWRQALDDGGLADARLADEHRVVLRAARQHLDDAADLLVAADDRVELALARQLGEVAAVALERLVLALGVLVGDALGAAHRGQRLEHASRRDAVLLQEPRRRGAPRLAASASSRCSVLTNSSFSRSASACAASSDRREARRQAGCGAAVGLRPPAQSGARRPPTRRRVDVHLAQQLRHDAVALLDERDEQVLGLDLRVVRLLGELLAPRTSPPGPSR